MRINQIFELSMIVDCKSFQKILDIVSPKLNRRPEHDNEYMDCSLSHKGITVIYRASQYKKKVTVLINTSQFPKYDASQPETFTRRLNKKIEEYFHSLYYLEDFTPSRLILSSDIDVHSPQNASAYLKVLNRIGRVKGFSPTVYEEPDKQDSFCLAGNSNGIEFLLYDQEATLSKRLMCSNIPVKEKLSMLQQLSGILRAEIRFSDLKSIQPVPDTTATQIHQMIAIHQELFFDVFARIIPYGNFYKKNEATEIIRRNVSDHALRRKMLSLLTLIPKKKSLYLAQKTMNCRNIDKVMDMFAKVNVSPVTISKRHGIKYLKCFYEYLFAENN